MKIPDIAESKAIKLFDKEFGRDIISRKEKFVEEFGEFNQAFHEHLLEPTPERLAHLLDEFSDVQGTFTHLASLFCLYQREMLHSCMDKVITRKTNPDYKRFFESKMKTIEYADGLKVSYIPVPEFDNPNYECLGLNQQYIPINRIPFISDELEYRDQIKNSKGTVLQFEGKENGYRLVTSDVTEYLSNESIQQQWEKV